MRNLLQRQVFQNRELRPELRECLAVARRHPLRGSPDVENLRHHLRQRHEALHVARSRRRSRVLVAVGQRFHPVEHADGERPAADRTAAALGQGLLRRQSHAALAVSVGVILPLLREELDRAAVSLARLQRAADRKIVRLAVEERRLARQLARRMRIGIRGQAKAVEEREPPVHRRVGGEPRLHRKDVPGEVAVALFDGIEAGLRAERREPRRPDVGRQEIGVRSALQRDLQEIARVEPEDWAAVGGDVADRRQPGREAVDGVEVRRVDQVVDLPGLLAFLVDRGDLGGEHESRQSACGTARRRQLRCHLRLDLRPEAEEAGLGGDQLLLQLREPPRVDAVARRYHGDAPPRRPPGEVLQVEIAARGARIFRMDVEVGVKAHAGPPV